MNLTALHPMEETQPPSKKKTKKPKGDGGIVGRSNFRFSYSIPDRDSTSPVTGNKDCLPHAISPYPSTLAIWCFLRCACSPPWLCRPRTGSCSPAPAARTPSLPNMLILSCSQGCWLGHQSDLALQLTLPISREQMLKLSETQFLDSQYDIMHTFRRLFMGSMG